MALDLEAIRARAAAARPGPWFWKGYAKGTAPRVSLVSRGLGGFYVMVPVRWGFQGAGLEFVRDDMLTGLKEDGMLRFEVCRDAVSASDPRLYRHQFDGINHPDAVFIAAARADVDALVEEVDRLRARVAAADRLLARVEDLGDAKWLRARVAEADRLLARVEELGDAKWPKR